MASTLGAHNPLRYRGYVYDTETGLYYLQTRYYDPDMGRFICADAYASTGQGILGNNMFAYCGNNPVVRIEIYGLFWVHAGKFIYACLYAINIEFGVGYGVDISYEVSSVKVRAGVYHDSYTFGLKDDEVYVSIKGEAGVSSEFLGGRMGLSTEYEHRYETNTKRTIDEHNAFTNPIEVYKCDHTQKNPLKFTFLHHRDVDGELGDEFVIGISGSKHFGVGYHYSVGWNVSAFFRCMNQ